MNAVLLALLVVPFASAATILGIGHLGEAAVKGIAIGGSALVLTAACVVAFPRLGEADPAGLVVASTAASGPPIEFSLYVDQLSAVLLLLANAVALLVQIYSLGYLGDDRRYPSYAALVSIFTGAMSLVVTADDLWVLLIGWELMGACSYFLISHHWELPVARAGAVKAFLMTRTADLGLLFAIIVLGNRFDSYRISTVMSAIGDGRFARDELWLPALLITVAVIGKSAQFPLHTWLPDAMPGPTPISALIHAATMVAAGVFLVARMYPLFLSAPSAMNVLALLAAVTMAIGATYALFTHDLKRVFAWSTVSQLAYMFGALAVGAYSAAVLHLLAHGAFKALLFLAAGSVVHGIGGSTSMTEMGALREKLPDTFVTMTIGLGALAGVVPLAGFFTKDAVMGATLDAAQDGRLVWPWVAWVLFVSMVVTALLTVGYALRAWLMVFFGKPAPVEAESALGRVDPHEPPWSMRVPLYVLTIPTVLGGLVVANPSMVFGPEHDEHLVHAGLAVTMTVLVGLTALTVFWLWRRHDGRDPWHPHVLPHPPVDRVYDLALVRPVLRAAQLVRAGDRDVVDGYANGTAASVRGLGWVLRRAQNGNVQGYLMLVVVGAAALAVAAGVLA